MIPNVEKQTYATVAASKSSPADDGSSNHLGAKIYTNNSSATYVNSLQLPI